MQRYRETILNAQGQPVAGVSVLVQTYPGGANATLYSDNGITPIANPVATNAAGEFSFYAADGRYQLVANGAGLVAQTVKDILLADTRPDVDTVKNGTAGDAGTLDGTEIVSLTRGAGFLKKTLTAILAFFKLDFANNADSSKGAALIGFDGGTARDGLVPQLASYTALRAYTGGQKTLDITSIGVAGRFVRDDSDTTSADNGGTIVVDGNSKRWKRVFSGALNVRWFGAKGDGSTDDTAASQATFAVAVANPARPVPVYYPSGIYKHSADVVVNVRDSSVSFNAAQLIIYGDAGRGDADASNCGTTISFPVGTGNIFRICEDATGDYPGGGVATVTQPLNFLRSIVVRDINFAGNAGSPSAVSGIVGRGIFASVIERCGFQNLNYGVRFGKAVHNQATENSTVEGISLDYCERNAIRNNSFRKVQYQVHILNPDISVIEGNMMSGTIDANGILLYWAGGNDFLDVRNNILHPIIFNTETALNAAIQYYFVRGASFHHNHFEYVGANLFLGTSIEYLSVARNLITGKNAVSNVFNLNMAQRGVFVLEHNNIAIPQPPANFISLSVSGDDGSFTLLKTVRPLYYENKAVTALGSTTPITIVSNVEGIFSVLGTFNQPNRLGRDYLWTDSSNRLRIKAVSVGAPSSDTDGNALQTNLNGATGSRPASPNNGQMYFDTTLNKPVWWKGTAWVDATGATV